MTLECHLMVHCENLKKKVDPLYLEVNNSFFDKSYDKLQWHGRPSSNEFQKISELWQKIKVEIQN